MPYKDRITIKEAMDNIDSKKYLLPNIQREFQWRLKQIKDLFDSVMQEFPIGSFLFWEVKEKYKDDYQFYEFKNKFIEREDTHNTKADTSNINHDFYAVLDGQQRLTSFYFGLKGSYSTHIPYSRSDWPVRHDKLHLYVNLHIINMEEGEVEDDNNTDRTKNKYEFEFWKNEEDLITDKKHWWFKVSEIMNFKNQTAVSKFVKNKKLNENSPNSQIILTRLYDAVHFDKTINYFTEESDDLNKVLNIFIRLNTGGSPLTKSQMLMSTLEALWKKQSARTLIYNLTDQLRKHDLGIFDVQWVLKSCLYLTNVSDLKFKIDNFKKENLNKIEDEWDRITSSLNRSLQLMKSFGFEERTLISKNALLPIAYYLHHYMPNENFLTSSKYEIKRNEIRQWFNHAIIKGTFSGQPDSALIPIRKSLNEKNDFDYGSIKESLTLTTKFMGIGDEEIERILKYSYGDKYTFAILSLLFPNIDYRNKTHQDHIHPTTLLENLPNYYNTYYSKANSILNLQILYDADNLEKQGMSLENWLKKKFPKELDRNQFMRRNYYPDCDLSTENIQEFLDKRKVILTTELKRILN